MIIRYLDPYPNPKGPKDVIIIYSCQEALFQYYTMNRPLWLNVRLRVEQGFGSYRSNGNNSRLGYLLWG